jgi:hypothetical protein
MKKVLSTPLRREFVFLILLPFLLWVGCFWGFIFGPLPQDLSDGSYAVKTDFFITNFLRGVYPLWDPGYYSGFPFDFFLRRIGDGNPFYLLVALAKAWGASDVHAYRFFLMFYYFLAVTGFWLICRQFLRHRLAYTGAYLILLFSAWGTRVFSDYILLIFVPLVWFFYFLITFLKEGKKHQFLGLLLAAAIAMTTYIPFFFITIVGVIAVFFLFFFANKVPEALRVTWAFIMKNKLFAGICCLFFVVAFIPEVQFFHESKQGQFVMPGRNVGTDQKSTLAVSLDHVKVGDLMSQGYFDRVFEDHKGLRAIDFFVPYFFFLVFIISAINPITRMTAFLAANILFMGILSVTDTSRIYAFLYTHIFVFKYMRMISFLFWMAVFPLAILFVMRQLDIFLDDHKNKKSPHLFVFVVMAHVLFGIWALSRGGVAVTSWIAILASLGFFIGILSKWGRSKILLGLLFVGIMAQPVEMISYVVKNEAPSKEALAMPRVKTDGTFKFKREELSRRIQDQTADRPEGGIYCGTKWYQDLSVGIPGNVKNAFLFNALYLMDNAQIYDSTSPGSLLILGEKWRQRKNFVFLSPDKARPQDVRSLGGKNLPETIDESSKSVRVLRANPMMLELRAVLDRPRFLLWTDNYHSAWHVFINGAEVPLLRVDHAFKGLWLPLGESNILFQFETPWMYVWRYGVWFSFLAALVSVIFLAVRERFGSCEERKLS